MLCFANMRWKLGKKSSFEIKLCDDVPQKTAVRWRRLYVTGRHSDADFSNPAAATFTRYKAGSLKGVLINSTLSIAKFSNAKTCVADVRNKDNIVHSNGTFRI
jgi:hypothetical protein